MNFFGKNIYNPKIPQPKITNELELSLVPLPKPISNLRCTAFLNMILLIIKLTKVEATINVLEKLYYIFTKITCHLL